MFHQKAFLNIYICELYFCPLNSTILVPHLMQNSNQCIVFNHIFFIFYYLKMVFSWQFRISYATIVERRVWHVFTGYTTSVGYAVHITLGWSRLKQMMLVERQARGKWCFENVNTSAGICTSVGSRQCRLFNFVVRLVSPPV